VSDAEHSAFHSDIDVVINGTELADAAVLSFSIDKDFGQPDMCAITLRNDLSNSADNCHTGIRPAETIEIKAGGSGEGASKETIFKGEVVGVELNAKAHGDSKVVVRGLNLMHRLNCGKKSMTFQSKSDQDCVSDLVGEAGLTADSGSDPSITYDHLYQHAQTNLAFIRTRAARLGFEVWCEDTTLYFKAPDLGTDSGIELNLETASEHHLKAFHGRLSAAQVVQKVTVQGWDPKKKEAISGEAEAQNSPLGSSNASSAAGDLGSAVTYTVDHPIFSVAEAQAIAKAKLAEHNMTYITGEAICRGHGAYKLGIVVKIVVNSQGADDPFNGKYLVRGVTHKYSPAGSGGQQGGFESILRLCRDAEKQ